MTYLKAKELKQRKISGKARARRHSGERVYRGFKELPDKPVGRLRNIQHNLSDIIFYSI